MRVRIRNLQAPFFMFFQCNQTMRLHLHRALYSPQLQWSQQLQGFLTVTSTHPYVAGHKTHRTTLTGSASREVRPQQIQVQAAIIQQDVSSQDRQTDNSKFSVLCYTYLQESL